MLDVVVVGMTSVLLGAPASNTEYVLLILHVYPDVAVEFTIQSPGITLNAS